MLGALPRYTCSVIANYDALDPTECITFKFNRGLGCISVQRIPHEFTQGLTKSRVLATLWRWSCFALSVRTTMCAIPLLEPNAGTKPQCAGLAVTPQAYTAPS